MGLIRRKARKREMLEFSLNITSLMDVLTVLLFFLLKSFSVTTNTLSTPAGLRLPASEVRAKLEETVNVALSGQELRANDKLIVKLQGGQFAPVDVAGRESKTIVKLQEFLSAQLKLRNDALKSLTPEDEKGNKTELPPGRILIQSDKDLSFGVVKYLLATAAAAGYSDYQFVVKNPEE